MTISTLPTTTSDASGGTKRSETDTNRIETSENRSKTRWREALYLHAESEKVLRAVFKVATPGRGKPHRHYRAILHGPGGGFHLAGGHVLVGRGGAHVEDPTACSEPPFWVARGVGLRKALCAVNGFVPRHRSGDAHVATQFLKGRRKCLTLWGCMKRRETGADQDAGQGRASAPVEEAHPKNATATKRWPRASKGSPSKGSSQAPADPLLPSPEPPAQAGRALPAPGPVRLLPEPSENLNPAVPPQTHSATESSMTLEPSTAVEPSMTTATQAAGISQPHTISQTRRLSHLRAWLRTYAEATAGLEMLADVPVEFGDGTEATVDALLRVREAAGGQSRIDDGRVEGAPELILEMFDGVSPGTVHRRQLEYKKKGVTESIVVDREGTAPWYSPGPYTLYPDNEDVMSGVTFPGLKLHLGCFYENDLSAQLSQLTGEFGSGGHRWYEEWLTADS